ncbi:MAG TPA: DUF72 domain-containing protein [Actinomycetes bacterium]|jgi:uncharacterized protein YecE (DUF72 family)|nr:DUF72 domain-containing protein [Actinomycetes bacterium]
MTKLESVRVGTCGWTDPTLIKARTFYPADVTSAEDRLRYYASKFPIVEVDATYYALPREEQAGLWVERTPPDFVFNIKAYSLLTQHPTRAQTIPKDLRESILPEHRDKQRIYPNHLTTEAVEEIWRRFREALLPLDSAGKLGAILLQFPEWHGPSRANRAYIEAAKEKLAGYRVCVEFRNRAWLATDKDRDRTLGFLREHELALVCLDMPQGFRSSIPPIAEVTNPALSVVRFHGRDPAAWGKRGATVHERFRYRYQVEELREWVPRIERLAESSAEVHSLMNNCYSDYAVVNGRQLSALLHGEDPDAAAEQLRLQAQRSET